MATRALSDQEWDALDELRFKTTDKTVFRNALIILMTAVGRPKLVLAHDLGCCPATIDNVRRRYRERGLAGLVPGKAPGRRSRATPEFRAALRDALQTPPRQLGYGFSVWSVARLGAHLERHAGVAFSDDHLRRLVHAEGFSFQRPKHTMRGKRDEAAFAKAQRRLRTLKKKRWRTSPAKS